MSLQPKNYRKGYRLYCKFLKKYKGPYFRSIDVVEKFVGWYDGDPRYIETIIDSTTWKNAIQSFTQHFPCYTDQILITEKKAIDVGQ